MSEVMNWLDDQSLKQFCNWWLGYWTSLWVQDGCRETCRDNMMVQSKQRETEWIHLIKSYIMQYCNLKPLKNWIRWLHSLQWCSFKSWIQSAVPHSSLPFVSHSGLQFLSRDVCVEGWRVIWVCRVQRWDGGHKRQNLYSGWRLFPWRDHWRSSGKRRKELWISIEKLLN